MHGHKLGFKHGAKSACCSLLAVWPPRSEHRPLVDYVTLTASSHSWGTPFICIFSLLSNRLDWLLTKECNDFDNWCANPNRAFCLDWNRVMGCSTNKEEFMNTNQLHTVELCVPDLNRYHQRLRGGSGHGEPRFVFMVPSEFDLSPSSWIPLCCLLSLITRLLMIRL